MAARALPLFLPLAADDGDGWRVSDDACVKIYICYIYICWLLMQFQLETRVSKIL